MKTLYSFFAGGGVFTADTPESVRPIGGLEYMPNIAAVYDANHQTPVTVGDILEMESSTPPEASVYHFSLPCPNFSSAKTGGGETEIDIAMAYKCADVIKLKRPEFVTLENVMAYQKSVSFGIILRSLYASGYGFDHWILNSADYGVPQTRKRLIMIARRDGNRPRRPEATHKKHQPGDSEQISLINPLKPWNGWMGAIAGIPLELSDFADWQKERLPEELKTCLIPGNNSSNGVIRYAGDPAMTISAQRLSKGTPRALLIDNQAYGNILTTFDTDEPAPTLRSDKQGAYRAFLADTQPHCRDVLEIAYADRSALAVRANYTAGKYKAFLVAGTTNANGKTVTIVNGDQPSFAAVSSVFNNMSRRAYIGGVVVKMNTHCLTRWQSMPDSYLLPESNTLASRIIGNGVPSLLGRRILETLT